MSQIIYCCSTYYHALIACVKTMVLKQSADILLTGYIPKGNELAEQIQNAKIFQQVFWIKEVNEYCPRNFIDKLIRQHSSNAAMVKKQLPVALEKYSEINIFHDDTWISRYCKDAKFQHNLLEDALDSFKSIDKTKWAYTIPNNSVKTLLKKVLHYGYLFGEQDVYTKYIEVNDSSQLKIPLSSKIRAEPREKLFKKLTSADKNVLRQIFLKESISKIPSEKTVLILTQPLFVDGMVSSELEQINLYRQIVKDYVSKSETLIIKAHPRDNSNYRDAFSDAIFLDKDMPIEVLNYCDDISFDRGIALFSTSITGLNCVKNKLLIKNLNEKE